MKKMKLLRVLKICCLMVLLVVVTNACAMELVIYQDSPDKFVREFPLMTLKRAHYRYNDCNDARAKAEIEKQIAAKSDKYFSMIFNVATKVPVDNHLIVVRQLCNNNDAIVNKFLKKSIAQALEDDAYTKEVIMGKAALSFKQEVANAKSWLPHYVDNIFMNHSAVFEVAQQIDIVDKLFQRDKYFAMTIVSREELQALAAIVRINPSLLAYWCTPKCNIYKKLTLPRFAKYFKNVVCKTGGAFGVAMTPLFLGLMSRIIELQLRNEDYFKIYLPYVGLCPWLLAFNGDTINAMPLPEDDKNLLAVGILGGLVSMLAMAFVMSREDIIWVSGAVVGGYATVCSLIAILRARAMKEYPVAWDKTSGFLKRKDIVVL